MKAYSLDLRERIIRYVQNGGTPKDAARHFNVGRSTVFRYLKADREGALRPKTSWGRWRKLDPEKLAAHVREHPDDTLAEMGEVFGVSVTCLWTALKKLKITLKKSHRV